MSAPRVSGLQEVVVSVADPAPLRRALLDVGGWKETAAGDVAAHELASLPWKGAPQPARFWVLEKDPGRPDRETTTRVRLIRFAEPGKPMRPGAHIYDVGGLMDMDLRTRDAYESFAALQAAGYTAMLRPVRYRLGDLHVMEGFLRGPDGEVLALIERLSPPLPFDWTGLSPVLISAHFVADLFASTAFWLKIPGVVAGPRVHTDDPDGPIGSLMPADHPPGFTVQFMTSADGQWMVEMVEADAPPPGRRDYSGNVHAPNRGVLWLSYAVSDLPAFEHALRLAGVEPLGRGAGRLMLRTPDAALLEFVQARSENIL